MSRSLIEISEFFHIRSDYESTSFPAIPHRIFRSRKQGPGFDVDESGGRHQEIAFPRGVDPFQLLQSSTDIGGDLGNPDFEDVQLVLADQMEQAGPSAPRKSGFEPGKRPSALLSPSNLPSGFGTASRVCAGPPAGFRVPALQDIDDSALFKSGPAGAERIEERIDVPDYDPFAIEAADPRPPTFDRNLADFRRRRECLVEGERRAIFRNSGIAPPLPTNVGDHRIDFFGDHLELSLR